MPAKRFSIGLEGIDAFEQGEFDIVLMDCEMPRMTGYEASDRIRCLEIVLSLGHTPIVALTAHALPENREKTRQAGMDGFLSKPFTLDQLRKCLLQHAQNR